jgi:hypothetical protein
VVFAAIAILFRSLFCAFRSREIESWLIFGFHQVFSFQIAFGLTLWIAASPIVHVAFLNPGAVMSDPGLSFWTLRHPLTMIGAFAIFQIGHARAKRVDVSLRARTYAVTFALVLIAIASAIPWPYLSYGRALIRGF